MENFILISLYTYIKKRDISVIILYQIMLVYRTSNQEDVREVANKNMMLELNPSLERERYHI